VSPLDIRFRRSSEIRLSPALRSPQGVETEGRPSLRMVGNLSSYAKESIKKKIMRNETHRNLEKATRTCLCIDCGKAGSLEAFEQGSIPLNNANFRLPKWPEDCVRLLE
jgi:hypothetical protein